jgi:hypothetical protein
MACGLVVFLMPSSAGAQERPRIGYVYPAGGRQGTTFQVTLGGRFLNDISRVYFSGSGVEASVVQGIKPDTEKEINALRERATQLMKGKPDAAARKEIAAIQRKVSRYLGAQMRRQTQPAISETVSLRVTLAAGAGLGQREMRVETPRGISNPLRFCVGSLPEFCEREPELVTELPIAWDSTRYPGTVTTDITLPAVVNGQIVPRESDLIRYNERFTPGDADRYRFRARKGQRLVIAAAARELIPYLADAVPGWFQATLALYDAKGKELAYDDDYRFNPDPVLFFTVPEDGQYVVEIKDAIYRGRPDFVYRITIGELPFIASIFPLGGRAGRQTNVELTGWNLPVDKVTIDAKDKAPGIYPLSVGKGNMISNTVPFVVDDLPECREREPNDIPQSAQAVTLPVIVNGLIDRPGDWDVFRFEGRAGQQIIAEVYARRLESPLDSVLELTDAAGKRLAFNDDYEDKADGLHTHHADSLINFTLPADGTYYLRLGDAQRQGGPEYAYRLRISAPRPDFELRVVPSCINAVSWQLNPITVFALRKDGFSGPIALGFKDPEGLALHGGMVPEGQDQVRVTLAVPPMLSAGAVSLCLEGRAMIEGKEVVRKAVGAEDMMQAFFYKHLVPASDLILVPEDRARFRDAADRAAAGGRPTKASPAERRAFQSQWAIASEQPAKIPAGATVEVQIRAPWRGPWHRGDETQVELSDPPEGIGVDRMSWTDKGLAIVLRGDAAKAKPGQKGNLIALAFNKSRVTAKDGKTQEMRHLMGPLPAIPFEIVKPYRVVGP